MQTLRISGAGALQVAKLTVVVAALAGCTTVQTPTKGDPLEGFNRTIFTVNDKLDQYALKPVAKGYVWATPQPVRDSVTNFFSNIGDVYIAANNLLQLKIADGVSDIMRIVINTIFGVGGLFDVATLAKLPKHDNDLGLTLGHYGVPPGPYLLRRRYLLTGGNASAGLPDYGSEAPPPKYEDVDGGAATAPAPTPASAPEAASGASSNDAAGAAQPASGTDAPPTVPGGQIVPPAHFGYPSLKL